MAIASTLTLPPSSPSLLPYVEALGLGLGGQNVRFGHALALGEDGLARLGGAERVLKRRRVRVGVRVGRLGRARAAETAPGVALPRGRSH